MEWTPISVSVAAQKAKSSSQLDTGIHSFGGGNWGASSCPNTLWACSFRVSCHPGHMAQIYWVPRCQSKGSFLFVCNILKLDCHQSYYYLAWPFACGAYGIKSCWSWGHQSENMYLNLLSCSWIQWNFVMSICSGGISHTEGVCEGSAKLSLGCYLMDKVHAGFRAWFCSRNWTCCSK